MSNLNELLQQLSEAAPGVCRRVPQGKSPAVYVIGDYEFQVEAGELWASLEAIACTGDPAHAWLRDALEREIARRGWDCTQEYLARRGCGVRVGRGIDWIEDGAEWLKITPVSEYKQNAAHALLTAFIAAIRAATSPAGDAGAK